MLEVTGEELEQLKNDNKNILVDFHGLWCVPCKQLMPKLELLAEKYRNIVFVKINVDLNRDYVMSLGIRSVPTIMIFNGNDLIDKSSGVKPDSYYKSILDKL